MEQRAPYANCDDEEDIVLVIRQWMASTELSQAPLLVAPKAFKAASVHFVNRLNDSPALIVPSCDDERRVELEKLADFLEKTYGAIYRRGISFIRGIAACQHLGQRPRKIEFLQLGPRFDQRRTCFTEPPDEVFIPRRMRVVFARQPVVPDID